MKIEKQINSVIKRIKLSYLLIFIVFNMVCFYVSFSFFSKEKVVTNELTLNMQIPRYASLDVGSYMTILKENKIFSEFDNLATNKIFNKKCGITPSLYDKHIYYYSEEKYISSFNRDIPIIVKIRYPDINIAKVCADLMLQITKDLFNLKKNELLAIVKERMEFDKNRKLERDIKIKEFLTEMNTRYSEQNITPEIRTYLTQIYLNDLRYSYESKVKTNLEIELGQNQYLEISNEIFIEKINKENFTFMKVLTVNLIISSGLIILFLFSLRKKA